MKHMANFAGLSLDWKSCIHSRLAFGPGTAVSEIYDSLRDPGDKANYAAIVDSGRPVGLISRAQIGIMLGSKYGQCLFGKKAAREYMSKNILCVCNGMPAQEVLSAALSRPDPLFYHDVVLVNDIGTYCGLISLRALVQLQAALLAGLRMRRSASPS